ncbi:uncharacterized protein EMH_0054400 [Eimeria mitis]|uniref:Uncharacterized protein n=1 Tax=Eimeria mitis TaxID=44415 RepID=U6K2J9_9EIME|nr:uncharacterized protein EMH_0054400 [Eimeria mitis]CDJ29998.1 hypothetical protein, conserved [Eimeria mitis]
MGDKDVQFGPFLPGQEAQEEEEEAPALPPPPPPLLYPRAAWDKARLQLALLLSRAAADVGAAPSTTAAATAAFHMSLPSFFHIDPSAVSSSLSASLFLSAKAADEDFNLRRVIASLGFCSHHASAAAEERRRQQQPLKQQQQHQQFAGEYVALGIKEYWRQRQSCFLEEQRLMQALAFSFPNPSIWQQLPLLLLLARPAAPEAAITTALVGDAAVGPLIADTEERVFLTAACLLARKLLWRFRERNKQQQQQQQQWLFPPAFPAFSAPTATPEHKAAAAETAQLLEDEISATTTALRPGESDTRTLLMRVLPLLQGIGSSIDQCNNSSSKRSGGPLCRQLAAAAKKMLLQYTLLLDETHGHQVYRRLTGVEA